MILNEANYHSPEANRLYMSSTSLKEFMSCESRALARLRGEYVEEPSTALLVGSYVDAALTGDLNLFKAQHPEILNSRTGELKADYQNAEYIIERCRRDEAFMAALNGQHQVIMTGEIEGVKVKCKIDSLLPDATVDLKCLRDMEGAWLKDEGFSAPFWRAWRYDIQMALYQSIRAQNEGGIIKDACLAVVTKEKPEPDIGLFRFSQSVLDAAMDEIRANIVYYQMIKDGTVEPESCGRCAWCRSQKVLTGWEELTA
jgi:hypothetical protein